MARDFKDFKDQYLSYIEEMEQKRESILRDYQERLRVYQEKLQRYREATSSFFTRWLGDVIPMPKAPAEPDLSEYEQLPNLSLAEVGQRFAIRYSDITSSINGVRVSTQSSFPPAGYNMVSSSKRSRVDETGLDTKSILGELADLWTVVEYLGNGQFKDLITEEIFVIPTKSDLVLNTVTQSTEQEARKQHESLQQHPLGIRAVEITKVTENLNHQDFELYLTEVPITDEIFPVLESLTPEIQESILQYTVPRKQEIETKIAELKQASVLGINQYFEKVNALVMDRYYEDAMSQSEKIHMEEEKIRQAVLKKLEEIKRQEQKAREHQESNRQERARLEREREVAREFDTFFSENEAEPVITTSLQK